MPYLELETLKLCVGPRLVESPSLFDTRACATLTYLSITQSSHSPLTRAIFTLESLQRLDLCRCTIEAEQAGRFSTFARLTDLRLTEVIVGGGASRGFAQALSHTELEYLSVRGELHAASSYLLEILDVVPLRRLDVFRDESYVHVDEYERLCTALRQKFVDSPRMVSLWFDSPTLILKRIESAEQKQAMLGTRS